MSPIENFIMAILVVTCADIIYYILYLNAIIFHDRYYQYLNVLNNLSIDSGAIIIYKTLKRELDCLFITI